MRRKAIGIHHQQHKLPRFGDAVVGVLPHAVAKSEDFGAFGASVAGDERGRGQNQGNQRPVFHKKSGRASQPLPIHDSRQFSLFAEPKLNVVGQCRRNIGVIFNDLHEQIIDLLHLAVFFQVSHDGVKGWVAHLAQFIEMLVREFH